MCGIAGLLREQPFPAGGVITQMMDTLRHRGPDGTGCVALEPGQPRIKPATTIPEDSAARVWLTHCRLSIIDLQGSHQPLANEDGSIWVTFNGEIYNYLELRQQLETQGHQLRTAGDTEVLVHLWEEYSERMVDYLVGMFAFAIFDVNQNRLFLARDRFGKKPLYYLQTHRGLSFASELQAFKPLDDFSDQVVDTVAAAQYFRYGYIPAPNTIYSAVKALPAGHYACYRNDTLQVYQYWRPQVCGVESRIDYDYLEALLDEAVRIRLRSDVPLGAFLSGGIDSALIVASMARQMDRPVETFTITTGAAWCDETEAAQSTAAHVGTHHHTFQVNANLVSVAETLASHYGQPFADYSNVPTYYVSRETRRHVTVALSGDGGDELFAGYERYANSGWANRIGWFPYGLRKLSAAASRVLGSRQRNFGSQLAEFMLSAGSIPAKGENHSRNFHRYWRELGFQPEFMRALEEAGTRRVDRFTQFYQEAQSPEPLERWLEVDQRMYLADDILVKVDIASMSVALECRAPLLDHRFAEAVNRIPIALKLQGGQTKAPLRKLAERRLPGSIVSLPKKGFMLPLATWLRGELHDWGYGLLFNNTSAWLSYLRPELVRQLWTEHAAGQADHSMRLWNILAWVLWWRTRQ